MAVAAQTNVAVYIGDLDASTFVNKVDSPLSVEMLDATTLGNLGYTINVPGLRSGEISAEGFQDFAVGGFYEKVGFGDQGVSTLMSIIPTGTLAAAGDVALFARGPLDTQSILSGEVGQLAKISVHNVTDAPYMFGQVLAPLTTRSSTASGTAVAMTGPTASQTLYAGLHVTTGSGGTLTVRVQTDDAVGFPSATTRITFTATTGPVTAGELKFLVPVNISTETHIRADWTISAGNFTFAVLAGVVPN